MGLCPSSCAGNTLIGLPTANCVPSLRRDTPNRLFFFPCDLDLPDPIQGNIKPLFDDGTIVYSSPLANIVLNDPNFDDVIYDECSPADKVVSTREMTFEDRFAISKTSGSPATTNDYFDLDVWQDKINNRFRMRYMIGFCSGNVIIPTDENGDYLTAILTLYRSYQKPQTQGGKWIEFKRGSIVFQGDPFNLTVKPAFNLADENIDI